MASPHVYLDSCCFIDVVKGRAGVLPADRTNHAWFIKKILEAHRAGHLVAHTSMVAVGECLAIEEGKPPTDAIKEHFRSLLSSGQYVRLVNPSPKTARLMQDFRWVHGLSFRSVDAMHIASALETGCIEFITTDGQIKKPKFVPAIPVMGTMGLRIITAPDTAQLPTSYMQGSLTGE